VLRYVKLIPGCYGECTPGDQFCVVGRAEGSRLGVITCYDGDLPEAGAGSRYLMGANVLIRGAAYMDLMLNPGCLRIRRGPGKT